MMRNLSSVLAGLVAAVVVFNSGCSDVNSPYSDNPVPFKPLSSTEKAVISGNNSFATTLFNQVSVESQGKNFFISPLSVSMALAMTMNGAAGQTYTQMQDMLGFGGMSNTDINESYQSLIATFRNLDPEVTFDIANSIWYRNTFTVSDSFITTNSTYFNAKVSPLDFSNPAAASTINDWVSSSTNGKITSIVSSPIPTGIVMYLINALYFHGAWRYEFPYADTKLGTFHLANGATESDSMMTLTGTFDYFSDSSFQAVELPYGDSSYSMVVLLPSAARTGGDPIPSLSQGELNTILSGFGSTRVTVTLPKFKINYSINLDSALTAMGMTDAFSPGGADFKRINPQGGLFISSVLHKTYVDVNEAGTKAAAVTVITVTATVAMPTPQIPTFDADRPFIFLIKANQSNTVMFMGAVTQPSAAGSD